LASHEIEMVLSTPRGNANGLLLTSTQVNASNNDPLKAVHSQLTTGAALTFEELSWPREEALTGKAGEVYCSSAQLLLSELMRLKGGQASVRAMLGDLP